MERPGEYSNRKTSFIYIYTMIKNTVIKRMKQSIIDAVEFRHSATLHLDGQQTNIVDTPSRTCLFFKNLIYPHLLKISLYPKNLLDKFFSTLKLGFTELLTAKLLLNRPHNQFSYLVFLLLCLYYLNLCMIVS